MTKVMKRSEVVEATGLCYTTIYTLEKQGKFPSRRQLSPGRVAWMHDEVMNWLTGRKALTSVPALTTGATPC